MEKKKEFYTEEECIEMMEEGKWGWLEYVNHHSEEWREEYIRYCQENGLLVGDESAAEFVNFKGEQLETAMGRGDA